MSGSEATFEGVARALEYPLPDTASHCRRAALQLRVDSGAEHELRRSLEALADYLEAAPNGEAEEHYTVLFDMKPVCSLYVGWHIFADTYGRGALLAGLAGELNAAKVSHEHDLPDYLPTLLRLVARQGDEDRVVLTHGVILRGLEKIEAAVEDSTAPWSEVLKSLRSWLELEVPRGGAEIPSLRQPLEVLQ